MRRLSIVGLVGIFLLSIASQAQALGPSWTLGYNCQYYFNPPATRADGVTPTTGALTYNIYLVQSLTQPLTMPATPTISNVTGTTAIGDPLAGTNTWKILLCLNINTPTGAVAVPTAGQWWMTVVAMEAGQLPGVQTSPPLPFALLSPGSGVTGLPTNGAVR